MMKVTKIILKKSMEMIGVPIDSAQTIVMIRTTVSKPNKIKGNLHEIQRTYWLRNRK